MLKMVQMRYQIPVQSHLSENLSEIEWVKELCPYAEFYGDAYDHFGLFGADAPTVMAHCVYSTEEEIQRMKENGVYVAHCPESNENLSSGIAPGDRQRIFSGQWHMQFRCQRCAGDLSIRNIRH